MIIMAVATVFILPLKPYLLNAGRQWEAKDNLE